ncbi:hypothetical protein [Oscillibacter sp.]|uniref:hypothetical protein n=1 Tax=Oscillibacter sp. TaxID=1945593 RepID=UPI0028998B3E|nr:hypothetical protein [Oscillibacter sp.]
MITIFNRQELITLASTEKFFNVREALSAAGISNHIKIRGSGAGWSSRERGIPGMRQDAMYTYTVYVHRDDYDKAAAAMQTALRNG